MPTPNSKKLNLIEFVIISFIWLLLFSLPVLFGNMGGKEINWKPVFFLWKEYSFLFILFIINRWILLPELFFKNKRIIYFLALGLLIVILICGILFLFPLRISEFPPKGYRHFHGLMPNSNFFPRKFQRELMPPHANIIIIAILVLGFDTGLNISIKWLKSEQEQIKLQKENAANQLAFLKNQVSPHFFLNTLNNIHSLVDIDLIKAKKSIIDLSRLMTYLLYDSQAEKVSLKDELKFIENYLDLMKLRFSDKVEILYNHPVILPEIQIPPLLFVSFIENSFKYGISYQKKSFIHIDFLIQDNLLIVSIRNSVSGKKEDKDHSGIGIINTKRRLDLLYKNNYSLKTEEKDNTFNVTLILPV